MATDLYKVLGLESSATAADIKKAYRRLARRYHPDVCKDPDAKDQFQDIKRAYEVLSDPERRANYDHTGSETIKDEFEGARRLLTLLMKKALITLLDLPAMSPLNLVIKLLDETQDLVNKERQGAKNILAKLKRHKGRVVRRSDGLNLYEQVIDVEIHHFEELLTTIDPKLEEIKKCRQLLDDYACEAGAQLGIGHIMVMLERFG